MANYSSVSRLPRAPRCDNGRPSAECVDSSSLTDSGEYPAYRAKALGIHEPSLPESAAASTTRIEDYAGALKLRIRREIVSSRRFLQKTQAQLAETLGVTPNTIGRWESGETEPPAVKLELLREFMRAHVGWK